MENVNSVFVGRPVATVPDYSSPELIGDNFSTSIEKALNYEDPMLLNEIRKIMNKQIQKAKDDNIDVTTDPFTPNYVKQKDGTYEEVFEPRGFPGFSNQGRYVYPLNIYGKRTSDFERAPIATGSWSQFPLMSEEAYYVDTEGNKYPDSFKMIPKHVADDFRNALGYDRKYQKRRDKVGVGVNVPMTPSLDNLFILNEELAHAYNELNPATKVRSKRLREVGPLAEMTNQMYEELDAKEKAYKNTLNQLNLSPNSKLTPDTETFLDYTLNTYFNGLRNRIASEQKSYDNAETKYFPKPSDKLINKAYKYYNTTPEKFAKKYLPDLLYPFYSNEDYIENRDPKNPFMSRWSDLRSVDIANFPEIEFVDEFIQPPMSMNEGQLGEGYFTSPYIPKNFEY